LEATGQIRLYLILYVVLLENIHLMRPNYNSMRRLGYLPVSLREEIRLASLFENYSTVLQLNFKLNFESPILIQKTNLIVKKGQGSAPGCVAARQRPASGLRRLLRAVGMWIIVSQDAARKWQMSGVASMTHGDLNSADFVRKSNSADDTRAIWETPALRRLSTSEAEKPNEPTDGVAVPGVKRFS
jgi:hypothetical protein